MLRFVLVIFLTSVTICAAQGIGCLFKNVKGYSPRLNDGESKNFLEESPYDTECDTDATTNASEDIASDHPPVCGLRNVQGIGSDIGSRISGDIQAENGEFPWMIFLSKDHVLFGEVRSVYQCGGSLIHPSVVVTAAHCISRDSNYSVRAGEWNTQVTNEKYPTQERRISDYIIHDKYNKGNLNNDIALLFVVEPFTIALNVKTICLPPQNHNFDLEHCVVSGWGNTKFDEEGAQEILKRVAIDIVPRDDCVNELRKTDLGRGFDLHDSFICAGEQGKDSCKGDGGSPLVCPITNTENRYYQSGIVSWGIGCGDAIPAAYVNVAHFRNWIEEKLETRGIPRSYFVAP